MKKQTAIVVAFLFVLSSCNTDLRRAKRYYRQAQEVAATDPDSALILIDSVLNILVFLDDDIRMNMSLMQAEALYEHPDGERRELSRRIKANKIYTMPELERSAGYFAEKGDYLKASYAALYSGYVLHELRDDDEAMLFFKDATKYAELSGDSLAFVRAQYNVARLLYAKYASEKAFPLLNVPDDFWKNNYAECAIAKNLLAAVCLDLNDYEQSETFFNQSLALAKKGKSDNIWRKTMNNYAVYYRLLGNYEQSIKCLQQVKNESDSVNLIVNYLNLGKVYSLKKEEDSASYYYDKMKKLLPLADVKVETVVSVYSALSKFAESQNDCQLALDYYKEYSALQNKVQDTLRKDNIYRIQQQYDYETLQNNMNRRIISNYRIEMMMAVLIIVVLVVALVMYYRIIQKNKKEAEMKAALLRVMKDNENLIKDKSDSLSEKLRSMQRLEILTKDQKDKYLLGNLEKEMFGDKNHWEVMTDLFNTIHPCLYDTLKEKYPDMSELERRVYMLSDFKLSRIDEALLLDVSTSVLDKARGKVKKLIEQDDVISTEAKRSGEISPN